MQLTRGLLARAAGGGARVYSRTTMTEYEEGGDGLVIRTSRGHTVRAGRLVIAMGYEVPAGLRHQLVNLNSSYALASEVVDSFGLWDDRCLIWESARPYCYLRTTPDNRVLIGGEDVPFRDSTRRDQLLPAKQKRLERHRARMLPGLETETAFAWAGTFGETPDGLPYIGPAKNYPRTLFDWDMAAMASSSVSSRPSYWWMRVAGVRTMTPSCSPSTATSGINSRPRASALGS